jgi:thymidine kinase
MLFSGAVCCVFGKEVVNIEVLAVGEATFFSSDNSSELLISSLSGHKVTLIFILGLALDFFLNKTFVATKIIK